MMTSNNSKEECVCRSKIINERTRGESCWLKSRYRRKRCSNEWENFPKPKRGRSSSVILRKCIENPAESNVSWIKILPDEILLHIFSYLPLAMLFLVTPHVCKNWAKLSMDWTLWKSVEYLQIKSMVVSTNEVKTLLRIIPRLKKLELVLRNDAEELLEALFHSSDHLEMLRLDRCSRSKEHTNIPPRTIQSILESCPKLKSVVLADTCFHSLDFYRSLAEKFRAFERINISCTTKSEMDFFVDKLKSHVSSVEFQNVSMMGRAEGKQIYWGPILGLVIRPNPTSPYHRQHANNDFPNYVF